MFFFIFYVNIIVLFIIFEPPDRLVPDKELASRGYFTEDPVLRPVARARGLVTRSPVL